MKKKEFIIQSCPIEFDSNFSDFFRSESYEEISGTTHRNNIPMRIEAHEVQESGVPNAKVVWERRYRIMYLENDDDNSFGSLIAYTKNPNGECPEIPVFIDGVDHSIYTTNLRKSNYDENDISRVMGFYNDIIRMIDFICETTAKNMNADLFGEDHYSYEPIQKYYYFNTVIQADIRELLSIIMEKIKEGSEESEEDKDL